MTAETDFSMTAEMDFSMTAETEFSMTAETDVSMTAETDLPVTVAATPRIANIWFSIWSSTQLQGYTLSGGLLDIVMLFFYIGPSVAVED